VSKPASPKPSWSLRWSIVHDSEVQKGGQGTIRKVQNGANQYGALKEPKSKKEKPLARFEREIDALLRCGGPFVPGLLDYSKAEGWYVAQWIEGSNAERAPSLDSAMAMTRALARIVEHCHQFNVIHRDIKPENIRVTPTGEIWLVDFGVAWLDDESTLTAIDEPFRNTLLVLPELQADETNKAHTGSDVALVGAMLLFWLTGRRPRQLLDSTQRMPHERDDWTSPGFDSHPLWPRCLAAMEGAFRHRVEERPSITEVLEILDIGAIPSLGKSSQLETVRQRHARYLESEHARDRERTMKLIQSLMNTVLAPAFRDPPLAAGMTLRQGAPTDNWSWGCVITASLEAVPATVSVDVRAHSQAGRLSVWFEMNARRLLEFEGTAADHELALRSIQQRLAKEVIDPVVETLASNMPEP
jgi:serine/threonine protein kinase